MTQQTASATFAQQFYEYWKVYGGVRALARSEFFWVSVVLTGVTNGIWREPEWWSLVLQTVPTLLGLSLAALTLFLGVGSEQFRELIAGAKEGEVASPFRKTAAIFLHFLVVQSVALFLAFIAVAAWKAPAPLWLEGANAALTLVFWGVGYFFFIYSLFTVLAAAFAIFEVVNWFDEYVKRKRDGGSS